MHGSVGGGGPSSKEAVRAHPTRRQSRLGERLLGRDLSPTSPTAGRVQFVWWNLRRQEGHNIQEVTSRFCGRSKMIHSTWRPIRGLG
jgi:hypothetical protein